MFRTEREVEFSGRFVIYRGLDRKKEVRAAAGSIARGKRARITVNHGAREMSVLVKLERCSSDLCKGRCSIGSSKKVIRQRASRRSDPVIALDLHHLLHFFAVIIETLPS